MKKEFIQISDLWRLSAVELNGLIRQKKVSIKEIVDSQILRIKSINPGINAVTLLLEDDARKDAEVKDIFLKKNPDVGLLYGVPFSVKENVDLAGSATTEGVKILEDNIVTVDSPHVGLLKKNGAIPLARTNMPDFGLRYHTDNELRGATINPWNKKLTPGGSSGGDAAAVATGMIPIGLGNDYGGSIRWPAQCCGVCGLRPSRGRIPFYAQSMSHGSIAPSLKMMAVQGPIARRIGDLKLALEIMSVFDSHDATWVPAPLDGKLNKPFRVAVIMNPGNLGMDDSVRNGVKKAAAILEKNGGMIEEINSTSLFESAQLWVEMISTDIRNLYLPAINKYASKEAKIFVKELLNLQTDTSLPHYINSLARINGIAQSWQESFQKYDVILGPVSSRNPFTVGADVVEVDAAKSIIESQVLTVTINLLGLPSVSLPVDVSDGIPQAVQIIGPMFSEYKCIELAQIIENEVGIFTPIDPNKD